MGRAAHARLADQGTHAHASGRLSRGVRSATPRPTALRCTGRATPPSTTRSSTTSSARGRQTLVKSKSMLTDECDMRPFLEKPRHRGHRDRSRRAHPAARRRAAQPHRRAGGAQAARRRRRGVLRERSGPSPATTDVHYLAESQRRHTRPYFLRAEAGMTGANFAIAETGSFVVCTNEGNADLGAQPAEAAHRLDRHREAASRGSSTSACSSACCPAARWARRSPSITSHFRAPRPGSEMHVVLVDNGRSERLGMARLLVFAEVHPLRRVHEHLPGLSAQRRAELRRDLLGADRRDHRSDLQPAQIQLAAVRLHAQRQLHQRLPGEDQHPRADLQVAPDHRRAPPAADREEGGDARRRQGARRARSSIAPPSRPRPPASSTCRASWSTTRSMPGAASARCRRAAVRPSASGTSRTAGAGR